MDWDRAQWYANDVAVGALLLSFISLLTSFLSIKYSRSQVQEAQKARALAEKAFEQQTTEGKQAADWSERSSRAAEESAKAANATVNLIQRAWVTVTRVEGEDRNNMQVPRSATTHFLNSGTTPAFDVRVQAWLRVLSHELNESDLIQHSETGVERHEDLGLNMPGKIKSLPGIVIIDCDRVYSGQIHLFVQGELKYRDVFGRENTVRWLHKYLPTTQKFHPIKWPEASSGH